MRRPPSALPPSPVPEFGEDVGQFLTPRGRFAIELYPTFARLVGKTFEFKVAYKSIARMFYLPKASPTGDEPSKCVLAVPARAPRPRRLCARPAAVRTRACHRALRTRPARRYYFVVSLDDPLRHGAQRHALLVMQLDRRHIVVPLNVSDEDIRAGKYEGIGKDSKEMVGDLPRVVAALFKHVTGKAIFKPGGFTGAHGQASVKASLKSNDGALYLLEKSLMFLHKPALWLRYSDVTLATTRRSTGASRTGELALTVKAGTALAAGAASGRGGTDIVFQALDVADLDAVRKYLESRDVPVEEDAHGGGAVKAAAADDGDDDEEDEDDDDDDDEDFDGEAEEEKEKVRAPRRGAARARRRRASSFKPPRPSAAPPLCRPRRPRASAPSAARRAPAATTPATATTRCPTTKRARQRAAPATTTTTRAATTRALRRRRRRRRRPRRRPRRRAARRRSSPRRRSRPSGPRQRTTTTTEGPRARAQCWLCARVA